MDRRDPLGMLSSEGPRPSRPRLARLVEASPARRLTARRVGLLLSGGVVLLSLLALLGSRLAGHMAGWIHRQSSYQLPFHEIDLDPPPPAWIRGGREELLETIREGRWPDRISVAEVDLKHLADDFRLFSPWVVRVESIRRSYPNALTVRLAYRKPCALYRTARTREPILLDRHASILPLVDVEPALVQTLPHLTDLDPEPGPARTAPGSRLNDPRVERALLLIDHLLGNRSDLEKAGTLRKFGNVTLNEHGLYVQIRDDLFVLWDGPPGRDATTELDDTGKWAQLVLWYGQNSGSSVRSPYYLGFQRDRIELMRGEVGRSGGGPRS